MFSYDPDAARALPAQVDPFVADTDGSFSISERLTCANLSAVRNSFAFLLHRLLPSVTAISIELLKEGEVPHPRIHFRLLSGPLPTRAVCIWKRSTRSLDTWTLYGLTRLPSSATHCGGFLVESRKLIL